MVENKKRGRGRPRCFDENEALDKAIGVFWAKGFEATSLDDLSAAMGMGRPSLYCAFGDKAGIFMRSLERYAATIGSEPLSLLKGEKGVRQAIGDYFRGIAVSASKDANHLGCYLGPVACAVQEQRVREFVADAIAFSKNQVGQRLQRAVDTGELPGDFPVQRRAQRASNAVIALSVRARHGIPVAELLEDAEDAVQTVLS